MVFAIPLAVAPKASIAVDSEAMGHLPQALPETFNWLSCSMRNSRY